MVREFEDTNYWALILGGSSGLGLASAKKLAQHGCNICIVHRNPRSQMDAIEQEFEHIKRQGIKLISFNADAVNPEKRAEIITELKSSMGANGRIRVVVHSIAKGNLKPMISDTRPTLRTDDFSLTINAMAISLYDWTKALFDKDLFAADSRVISFTSEGNKKVWQNYAAVSAAKVALEAITRNIALEFAPFGIKANCIQAGVTDTASMRAIPGSTIIVDQSLLRNPFKRLTRAEDVANVVYLLTKDEAAWINGTIIPVDGGEHMC
jgi:enoyl-[acyl-carrier protein] reductase III